jgi:non-ribosomal peptide synthetase-like protein
VLVAKWVLIGRYTQAEWPLWSHKVWLSEFVTSTYESLLEPILTEKLIGTPYLAWCFRLLGVQIGARVTMLSSDITEYDMVSLGDEVVINRHSGTQTHLFEDRVMKVGYVHLEERGCMKPYSICLPNSKIEKCGQLGSLSLLMKGESVPANHAFEGAPIAPRGNRRRAAFTASFAAEETIDTAATDPSMDSMLVRARAVARAATLLLGRSSQRRHL